MNIFLTYDYELFFGETAGSVDKCMIEPTRELINIADENNVQMVFFVDVGYLMKLKEFSIDYPSLQVDQEKIHNQIKELLAKGHDIQLHIHPHWEKSFYANGKWTIMTKNAYKLDDFGDDEITRIVTTYKNFLDDLIGYKTTAFRAGGWCIQPFYKLKYIFEELGIRYDSSVFPGGKFSSSDYSFDFTNAPHLSHYTFSDNECVVDPNGFFTEYPISSMNYSPLFYWRLYILGRLFPSKHKMVGDGIFLAQPGRKKSVLTNFTWNHISSDGYYASKLVCSMKRFEKQNREDLVIIGHPKGMTRYSFKALSNFIKIAHKKHAFMTFKDLV